MSPHRLKVTICQAKEGSTEAFDKLFDAAQSAHNGTGLELIQCQFAPSRSDEALRVVHGVDPSDYPTPEMHGVYVSLKYLATELAWDSILCVITKRSTWDCIGAWMQFFLQHVVEDEPCTEDVRAF
jgi:hypothetical protein